MHLTHHYPVGYEYYVILLLKNGLIFPSLLVLLLNQFNLKTQTQHKAGNECRIQQPSV